MIRIPILNYHCLSDDPAPWIADYTVTPGDFARHLDLIVAGGRTVVPVSRLAEAATGRRPLPRDPVVITFDDGFADFADIAAPALAARGLPSTFYAATGSLEGRHRRETVFPPHPMVSWSRLPELEEQGVEIGAHSHTHRDLDLADPRVAAYEVVRSKELLEDALGHEITSFAYPYGHFTTRLLRVVAECGYDSACAVRSRLSRVGDNVFALARLPLRAATTVDEVGAWVSGRGARTASARPDTLGIRADRLLRRVLRMPVLPEDGLADPAAVPARQREPS
ncbi:polysaccharide deacetylase family protein [Streptomyces sp. NPDC028635]|uniref:polysaccharide deacetylase family protein n=1 Tax=Streptomyces sp. NPDC028635 TaxID=3154800 RepID=UPI0033C1780B